MVASFGCNLAFDLDEYPYSEKKVSIDLGEDMGSDDGPTNNTNNTNNLNNLNNINNLNNVNNTMDMPPDLPVGEPELVITELLINTSAMDNNISTGELGEYVEIKNVGDGPADPRQISFRLLNVGTGSEGTITVALPTTSEQVEVYQGLKVIEPGQYFVFARHVVADVPINDVLEAGTFYDYGRWGEGDSLSNSGERLLELQYFNGTEIQQFDSVRWISGNLVPPEGDSPTLAIQEDRALSVRGGLETTTGNDSPDTWCEESATIGAGIVAGTPGTAPGCP